jgi:3-methyladenine DNA glycosylase AlkD
MPGRAVATAATAARSLARDLRAEMRRRADPAKAEPMQRYMKSAMPYHGLPAPVLRAICRETFARHPLADQAAWRAAVLLLWRDAERREERYAAIELLGQRSYAAFRTLDLLPVLEEIVTSGAWWDYVDPIATHRLRELLGRHREAMSAEMRRWSRDPHLWKRRSSILCQVRRKGETDLELLYDCIEPNLGDRDFFIRKAIGWALRDYAWHDFATVDGWVKANEDRLSGLSKREALKNPPEKRKPRRRPRA